MAINPSLLIAAPMLQDPFIDDVTGLPMAGGTITMFQDSTNPQIFKPWYYQTGVFGAYTYTKLPNPLTLSSVGTIQDGNGNDVIPYYYPYSEADNSTPQPYYVVVKNADGQLQFTRNNFPNNPITSSTSSGGTLKNLIVNGEFWRNIGTQSITAAQTLLCPSQHDGLVGGDMYLIKNTTDATETVTFGKFVTTYGGGNVLSPNDVTPEYYMNLHCTVAGTETSKYLQIPMQLHLNSLSNVVCTASINAVDVNNSGAIITLQTFSYTGAGGSVTAPVTRRTIPLTGSWARYDITFTIPNIQLQGYTLGNGGDDAFYLTIGFPLAQTCNINIAKPSVYIGSQHPTNDWDTYDSINSIISSPRTGDVKISINNFGQDSGLFSSKTNSWGWVLMNDGTIGNPSSSATARAAVDTWPLFNYLYQNVNQSFATVSGGRSGIAINDFNANKTMTLTLALGRALIGMPPSSTVTYTHGSAPPWNSGVNGYFTITANNFMYIGSPVYLTGTLTGTAFTANTVYYMIPAIDGSVTTQFQLADTYAHAIAGTAIAASGGSDGSGIVLIFAIGGNFGEYEHTQLINSTRNELVSHNHAAPSSRAFVTSVGAGFATPGAGNQFTTDNTTASTGSGNPFNIVMPATYYNIFMKL